MPLKLLKFGFTVLNISNIYEDMWSFNIPEYIKYFLLTYLNLQLNKSLEDLFFKL